MLIVNDLSYFCFPCISFHQNSRDYLWLVCGMMRYGLWVIGRGIRLDEFYSPQIMQWVGYCETHVTSVNEINCCVGTLQILLSSKE